MGGPWELLNISCRFYRYKRVLRTPAIDKGVCLGTCVKKNVQGNFQELSLTMYSSCSRIVTAFVLRMWDFVVASELNFHLAGGNFYRGWRQEF